ncbi:L-rhamnose mutarotase [bacterium]|nr:L-rhamnose mutarotase [bacterium]
MVIGLRPERVAEYKRLHAAVWPGVLDAMRRNGWSDFDIFLKEPENLLFGTFKFDGPDFAASARAIGADPETQRWLALTDACQVPFETRKPGEWWAYMENVFHMD